MVITYNSFFFKLIRGVARATCCSLRMQLQGPTLKDIYVRDKDGKEKEPKRLLGRVPVLDSQFLIPRPVTSATITFHGMCAFNSIAFYGRRAENSMRPFNDEKTTRDYI